MTNEQWLVYLWSIYPSGGYQVFYAILLFAYLFFIIFALISYSDASDRYKTDTVWYKMGKWKIIIHSVLNDYVLKKIFTVKTGSKNERY